MPVSSPLRIAVVGAGKIGSTFAFQLAHVGRHDVTVVARPGSARLQQLLRDGGIVDVAGERADVRVTDTLDEETPFDLVIVTVLAHQVDSVLPALQRSAAKCIQFMFVNFEPERLRAAVGAARCAFGMPFVQAVLDKDGKLKSTISPRQKTIMSRQPSVDVFDAAGVPAALEPDMALWLRCHTPLCVAFESIAVAGQRGGGGSSWREASAVARGLHESFTLIKHLGFAVYPKAKVRINGAPTWLLAFGLWVFSRIKPFRELLATGENECRSLVDTMVAATPNAKPAVNVARIRAMKPA